MLPIIPNVETQLGKIQFRYRNILPILQRLNIHKYPGPDGSIPPKVLTYSSKSYPCATVLVFILEFPPDICQLANQLLLAKVIGKVIIQRLIRY